MKLFQLSSKPLAAEWYHSSLLMPLTGSTHPIAQFGGIIGSTKGCLWKQTWPSTAMCSRVPYCKSVSLMFSNKLDINSYAVRDGFCKSSHNSILKTTFNQVSLLYYFIICLWSETVGYKTVIITSIRRISLLLTLNLMLCPHSHVITMISYSCLWYNYNIATSHDSSTTKGRDP